MSRALATLLDETYHVTAWRCSVNHSLSKKRLNGCNPAVPGNDEISIRVCWRLTRAARYPLDPPAIAHFLRLGYWLISKVRVSSLDRARDSIDLVAASVDASFGVVEHAIFGEDCVNRRAPTRRVVLTEDVVKIADTRSICCRTWLVVSPLWTVCQTLRLITEIYGA